MPARAGEIHNELGNIHSARLESAAAYASHQKALSVIQQMGPEKWLSAERASSWPAPSTSWPTNRRSSSATAGRSRRRARPARGFAATSSREGRAAAVRLLEQLAAENPNIPDYRFFLALCLRPRRSGDRRGRRNKRTGSARSQFSKSSPPHFQTSTTTATNWRPPMPGFTSACFPARSRLPTPTPKKPSQGTRGNHGGWPLATPRFPSTLFRGRCSWRNWPSVAVHQGRGRGRRICSPRPLAGEQSAARARHAGLPAHHRVLLEFIRLKLAQATLEADGKAAGDAHRRSRSRAGRDVPGEPRRLGGSARSGRRSTCLRDASGGLRDPGPGVCEIGREAGYPLAVVGLPHSGPRTACRN